MTLVEEIARAIEPDEGYWQHFLPEAQAALSVILQRLREPSGDLIGDVDSAIRLHKGSGSYYGQTHGVLRALADHLERNE